MIIGYNSFGDDDTAFDTVVATSIFNKLELKNTKYDEIKIDNIITNYSTSKEMWSYSTVFHSLFNDNLNAGNVNFLNMIVSTLRIKRRKKEEFDWQILGEWEFDVTKKDYEIYDKQIESYQPYEYLVVPVISGGIEGNLINIKEITPIYDGTFLSDITNTIPLIYDVEWGGVTRNQKSETLEPINSRYPIVVNNGSLDYCQGSIQAVVIAGDLNGGSYDVRLERLHRKKIMDFLCNRKPKLIKNGNGEMLLVKITGNPKIDYFNNVGQIFAKIQFEWIEIGDANSFEDLTINGLL